MFGSDLGSDLGTAKGLRPKLLFSRMPLHGSSEHVLSRSILYFYRDMVETELEKLVSEGTLEPVEHSDWATPIVAVFLSQTNKGCTFPGIL